MGILNLGWKIIGHLLLRGEPYVLEFISFFVWDDSEPDEPTEEFEEELEQEYYDLQFTEFEDEGECGYTWG